VGQLNRRELIGGAVAGACLGAMSPGWAASAGSAAAPVADEPSLRDRLRSQFVDVVEKTRTVGAQLTLLKDGQRFEFVAGRANAELDLPMTGETLVQIGSSTKLFNAALVMSLVDAGRMALDAPVARYLPTLRLGDASAAQVITVRQLLSMTSGLDNGPYTDFGSGSDSLARYVASLDTLPQLFAPGSGFGYSNAGTSIAGHAAATVAGKSWDSLLVENILAPAGLTHAASLESDFVFHRVAVGHEQDGSLIRPWYTTRSQAPAGSTMAMSAGDLASFGALMLDHGVTASGRRILSEQSCVTMMTPQVDTPTERYGDWCVGSAKSIWQGVELWGHAGGNKSGSSYLFWIPARRGVIAFTSNTPGSFSELTELLFTTVADTAFGIHRPRIVRPPKPVKVRDPARFVGKFAGSGFEVTVAHSGNDLKLRRVETFEGNVTQEDFTLTALGGDRFLMDERTSREVAFFGNDRRGRAMNLVAPLFAMRRVD
jgi:CubicO group peptidase (beta-lactamase class C family)